MKKAIIIILLLCVTVSAQTHKSYESFSAGELSPYLLMRESLAKYHSGCSVMENFIPLPQGPAMKRPGTKYVAGSKEDTKIRLLPFVSSTDETTVIELGNQYARFFRDGAQIVDGVGTETLTGSIVAHYKLNDTETATVVDADGATHNMTASTGCSDLTTTGKVNACFDLDGQYDAELADHDNFSFTDDSNDSAFSIACWVYIEEQKTQQTILSKWKDDSLSQEWRFIVGEDRKLQLNLVDSGYDLTTNRVAHWKLNETAANNTILDDDATSHDGLTQVDTCDNLTATGVTDTCIDFGGTDSIVITNDHDELSFGDSTNDSAFSISAWIYVSTYLKQFILSKHDATTGANAREWQISMNMRDLEFRIYDESANALRSAAPTEHLSDGWHHIIATYGGAGGNDAEEDMNWYVDGALVSSNKTGAGTYVAMENLGTKVVIGAHYDTDGNIDQHYEDKIDNVILFNAELTAANAKVLYNNESGTETLAAANAMVSTITDTALAQGWRHIVSTYSAPPNNHAAGIILYVDSAVVDVTATEDDNYTAMQNGGEEVRLGSQRNTGDTANENFWAGLIDNVAIFSDVLTPAEVVAMYSATPYEVTTPYLTADLYELQYKQSADVLFISHPDYETRMVIRYADNIWALAALEIENGPFRDENKDETYFITPSATTGNITLTASGTDNRPFVTGTTGGHEPSGSSATSKSQTGALFKIIQPLETAAYEEILSDNYTSSQTEDVSWMDCGSIAKGVSWNLYTLGDWTATLEVQRNYTIGAAHDSATWETVYTFQSTDDRNIENAEGEETEAEADYRVILTSTGDNAEPCQVYFTISDPDHAGIVEITSVTSPTVATGTVLVTLADTSATHRWAEGSWSNYRGWPRTVTFFEDRLTFGGNTSQPDTIWTSVSSDYYNFLAGANDDDALIFTLSSRQVNVIEWLVGKEKLLIGTSGAEWSLSGEADEALSPSSYVANENSNMGSASLQAVVAGESVLFFQRGAKKMRELAYNWEIDSYITPDMTILANHITGDGITDLGMQTVPNSIVWCVREDGEIALFIYDSKEQITSWSRVVTDGEFESVAIVPGDPEDEVWVSVKRAFDGVDQGADKRYIEYFSVQDFGTDVDDAYYVDCGITYDSTAATTITGLDHLEGESVYVLADGAIQSAKTVTSGDITIASASTVQAGLPFTAQLKTMPLSLPSEGSTILGMVKRINEVFPRYYNSGDFYIGRDADNLELLGVAGMDTSDVDTDDNDRVTFPAGNDRYGYILVYQRSAEPLTLLSLIAEVN